MNRKIVMLLLLWVLLPLLSSQTASAVYVDIKNMDHYIIGHIDFPETVDPAWAYDAASAELIGNIYEPLISFDREKIDEFVPALATNWVIEDIDEPAPHGLFNWKQRITFDIRVGVPFQDGVHTLTTEDVEYSFERWLVQDRSGGPAWMIYEPTHGIGIYHAFSITNDPVVQAQVIDQAFQHDETHFWINLAVRYAPIMTILAQYWASIVNEDFMIAKGDWNHDWATWVNYRDPAVAPVDRNGFVACGTGPYALDYVTYGYEWSIVRFPSYWRGWPYAYASKYLKRVTHRAIYDWNNRLQRFRDGDIDVAYVPRQYIAQVEGWPGIRYLKGLPTLSADAMFFNFNIDPSSQWVGTGSLGNGIPLNFFSDIRIRKGFAYMFNYTKFLNEVWLGEAVQPSSPIIGGIAYHNPNNPLYYMNLNLAKDEFEEASNDPTSPAYRVMTKGFKFTIPYLNGNLAAHVAAYMLKDNIKLVNSKFNIDVCSLIWRDYLSELCHYPTFRSVLPMYMINWWADYPDPHNFVMPFMDTQGVLSFPSSYSHPVVDALIEAGIATPADTMSYSGELDAQNPISPSLMNNLPCGSPSWRTWPTDSSYYLSHPLDTRWPRRSIYYALQRIYFEELPSVMLEQPFERRWERDWVQGWYYNPLASGWANEPCFYHLWKGLNGDINGDNTVDALDWAAITSAYWWTPSYHGTYGAYNPKADVAPPLMYIEGMLPPPGTSVGWVDTGDLAVLNAHWGETTGP